MVEAKKICEGRKWCPAGTVARFHEKGITPRLDHEDMKKIGGLFSGARKE